MDKSFFIARDKDNRLFQFRCRDNMLVSAIPHRHVNGYPFDGNYYSESHEYLPVKGEEMDRNLFPNITYENSPVWFVQSDTEESIAQKWSRVIPNLWKDYDLTPMGNFHEYEMISLARHCPL